MSDNIDKRILELEKELAGLRRQKLSELQIQVAALQASLNSPAEAEPAAPRKRMGRPPKAAKGWAAAAEAGAPAASAGRKRRGRKRGKHISDDDALAMLTKVVTDSGKDGISARQAAELSGVFYPRAIKLMDSKFKKSGSGKWTRYNVK